MPSSARSRFPKVITSLYTCNHQKSSNISHTKPHQIVSTMGVRTVSQQPFAIKASHEEVLNGQLTEQHLEQAVRHILKDGLVVVENAIEHSVIDKLNDKMVEDAKYLRSLGEKGPFNYNPGNLQQDAPPVREYFDPSIFLSECVRSRVVRT